MPLWKAVGSAKTFQETGDQVVEIAVLLAQFFDLADGVDDGRVVLAAKAPADLRKRCVGQRLAQVHGDLARHGDRLRIVARLQQLTN